jgi:flavin-dependent dehydrogenase
MQSADLACEYIHQYLSTGNENFESYRKKWRQRKLLKWRLSEVSARRMYSKYTDQQVENRVQFFHKNFSIDVLIESLFNFKYNRMFSRIFQFLFLKLKYTLKKERF